MKDSEKCLDSQLWHACAGGMVQMPSVNSKVYYFPQGQAEHAHGDVDFQSCQRIPPLILCSVSAIKFMADPETDEVFARIWLVPVRSDEQDVGADDGEFLCDSGSDVPEKLASFAKTLTQSDANNGGGFSVPRYCAETIFPRLDYSMNPPVQTVLAKDVHGKIWKFRHIYRGTPRRHLLTTGWSTFVNQKKLVAGDSIVFLRTENGDLCVGIRRAKRGVGGGPESPSGWNPPSGNCMPSYGGFSVFLREKENKFMRSGADGGNPNLGRGMSGRCRVRAESVIEAAVQAANGQPFEVSYYPRASTPEFCVKAAAVRASMMIMWCPGMRFKMAFETEDSSRISWFMGTISSVHVADPIHWPNSLWRLLQVTWDEPDLLQNVKRVSPWLVELMPTMPTVHQTPFSPSRKKLCLPQPPDFPLDGHLPKLAFSTTIHQTPFSPSGKKSHLPQPPDFPLDCHLPTLAFSTTIHQTPFSPSRKKSHLPQPPDFPLDGHLPTLAFSGNPRGTHSSPLCYLPDSTPAGIQGARHAQFGISLSNPHLNKLQSGLFPASFHRPDDAAPPSSVSTGLFTGNATIHDSVSCLLTIGNPSHSRKRSHDAKTPQFLLFGQPILTEQQISLSYSGNTVSPGHSGNSLSDGNAEKMANLSDGSSSAVHQHVPADNSLCFPWYSDQEETEPDLEIGHCKVFMESVDVGRTLDLSVLSSYEELYGRLADMFSADKSEMMSHVLYRDAKGAVRHTGDEPFGEFTRRVRRLTILVDSSSDNIGRECTV